MTGSCGFGKEGGGGARGNIWASFATLSGRVASVAKV